MSKINKQKIAFNYQKSSNYQNFYIDGVYGGVLPTGNIWFDTFIEKGLTPDIVVSEIDMKTGNLNEVSKSPDTNGKMLRELQSGFVLNLSTAKVLRDWLEGKIEIIEKADKKIKKK
jgi:hypothetical protein